MPALAWGDKFGQPASSVGPFVKEEEVGEAATGRPALASASNIQKKQLPPDARSSYAVLQPQSV